MEVQMRRLRVAGVPDLSQRLPCHDSVSRRDPHTPSLQMRIGGKASVPEIEHDHIAWRFGRLHDLGTGRIERNAIRCAIANERHDAVCGRIHWRRIAVPVGQNGWRAMKQSTILAQ